MTINTGPNIIKPKHWTILEKTVKPIAMETCQANTVTVCIFSNIGNVLNVLISNFTDLKD